MAKSKPPRKKQYRQSLGYGNKKIPAKAKWMRITKLIAFTLLSILLLAAITGMIIKYYHHIKYHNK